MASLTLVSNTEYNLMMRENAYLDTYHSNTHEVVVSESDDIQLEDSGLYGEEFGSYAISILVEEALNEIKIDEIVSPSVVRDYLYIYPDMSKLLMDVNDLVITHFDDPVLSLDVYQDPDSQYKRLILNIRLAEYDNTVVTKIKTIRKIYRNLYPNMKDKFLLMTDFRFATKYTHNDMNKPRRYILGECKQTYL